jgi:hypothetical protein
MKHQFGWVGTVGAHPELFYYANGSTNTTVRVRGTTFTMAVSSPRYKNGDVFVQFGAPYTGTVILENTSGTQLGSTMTVNNASSVLFSGAAA